MLIAAAAYPRLLGDIGATHARFASKLAVDAPLTAHSVHDCRDFGSLESVLRHRLVTSGEPLPAACALGIATAVTGDWLQMTNLDWSFSVSALRDRLALPRLLVINDFETLARAVPLLSAADLDLVGGGAAVAHTTKAVLGPGTGLGVSGLAWTASGWAVIAGEGGHVTLAAEDDIEEQVIRHLRERFGHVSAERVLSGPGLTNLYQALCAVSGVAEISGLDPAEITRRALAGSDAVCRLTALRFLGWLGAVAGDLALTLGARGGVYVGGGIAPQLRALFDESSFRRRFEGKGRFRSYLAEIPTWIIADASDAALRGASAALDVAPEI
jgi:glucokinase